MEEQLCRSCFEGAACCKCLRTLWFLQRPICIQELQSQKKEAPQTLSLCPRRTQGQRRSCRWVWLCLCSGTSLSAGAALEAPLTSRKIQQTLCKVLSSLQDVSSREVDGDDLETVVTAASRSQSKVTLNELLDTLRLLEEEPELLPPPKLFKRDRYAWIDGVSRGLSLVTSTPGQQWLHGEDRFPHGLPPPALLRGGGGETQRGHCRRRCWRGLKVLEGFSFVQPGLGSLQGEAKPCEGCGRTGVSTEGRAGYWDAVGGLGRTSTSAPKPSLRCSFGAVSAQQEPSSNSLTADNLEKFGKLNHSPGVPEDGALLSEAKLQSIISFLDEMEKSEQERPRSAASVTQREVSTGARAHLCWMGVKTLVGGISCLLVLAPGGAHHVLIPLFPVAGSPLRGGSGSLGAGIGCCHRGHQLHHETEAGSGGEEASHQPAADRPGV